MKKMKRIGLLGGTFDPPHYGHLMIANEACWQCNLDEVWFIPTKEPPHKQLQNITDVKHRLTMLEIAISDNDSFRVCPIELDQEGPSYTINTVKRLKAKFEQHTFFFIIGADMVQDLPNWKEIDELLTSITFIGVNRQGFERDLTDERSIHYINVPDIAISSTILRQRVKENKSIRYFLPDCVRTYIEENEVYG